MGLGGVAIAALFTVICLKVPFSDGLGGIFCIFLYCTVFFQNFCAASSSESNRHYSNGQCLPLIMCGAG